MLFCGLDAFWYVLPGQKKLEIDWSTACVDLLID
jgi:hypothetical protein